MGISCWNSHLTISRRAESPTVLKLATGNLRAHTCNPLPFQICYEMEFEVQMEIVPTTVCRCLIWGSPEARRGMPVAYLEGDPIWKYWQRKRKMRRGGEGSQKRLIQPFPVWTSGARSPWGSLGGCVQHASEFSHGARWLGWWANKSLSTIGLELPSVAKNPPDKELQVFKVSRLWQL